MGRKRQQERAFNPLWVGIALGVLILVAYSNSFSAGLIFDSEILIKQDPRLRSVDTTNLEQIFTKNYWWPSQESLVYRPVTTLTYLFNYSVLGNAEGPAGYHAVNLLLHWVNAWLVFVIVRRLAGRIDIAALAAGLFAGHPINTEAVTNVVGRADLLATLSVLFAGWCYLRSTEDGARKIVWLAVMGVAACVGVLAKENAVTIVAFVALYDLLWRWPDSLKKFVPAYVALLPSLLLIFLIRRWVAATSLISGEFFLDNPIYGATPFHGFMTALGVIGRYVKLLVFPRTLSADYSFNQIPLFGQGGELAAWLSLVLIVAALGAAIYFRRQRVVSWGILFFFLMLLPTSNLLIKIGSIMADRFLYLPSIGFCAVAAVAVCWVSERIPGVPRWVLPVVLVVALGVRTFVRNRDWHDDLSLWTSTVAASPNSFKAQMLYGNAVLVSREQEGLDEAIAHSERARAILETQPPLPLKWQNATIYLHLAKDYRLKGLYEKSLEALNRAQAIDARSYLIDESFCLTYVRLKQWDKCVPVAQHLQEIAPDQAAGYQLLGASYLGLGKNRDAAVQFLAGWLLHPERQDWVANLNITYKQAGAPQGPFTASGSLDRGNPVVQEQLKEAEAIVKKAKYGK